MPAPSKEGEVRAWRALGFPDTQQWNEYLAWLRTNHDLEISEATRNQYDSVVNRVRLTLSESPYWRALEEDIRDWDAEFQVNRGFVLMGGSSGEQGNLETKPFVSFVEKTLRLNVIRNRSWPQEPRDGWITDKNWFERINDAVRTTFTVKYLDGVLFLLDHLKGHAEAYGMECETVLEARAEGYYAAHVYVKREYEVPGRAFITQKVRMPIEIQITTQVQSLIRSLTHRYYEQRRLTRPDPGEKWQWRYESDEFVPNYLAHILHYVEGMIMEVRSRPKEQGGTRDA